MFWKVPLLSIIVALAACQMTIPESEDAKPLQTPTMVPSMKVELLGNWNGRRIPSGQQCVQFGGNGSTPPMRVRGIPEGTSELFVFFNDIDYPELSENGGHGVVAFEVFSEAMILPPLPAMTKDVGSGARVVKRARTGEKYASEGYLPPCSGGRGHRYEAYLVAMTESGQPKAASRIFLGRY